MAATPKPTLFLLAGPNGAGKSTLYHGRIKPITHAPFINADDIARTWLQQGISGDAYAASREAAKQRQQFLRQRRSFVSETVFSHPSKLDLVKTALAADYRVVLYHVNVRHPDISVARVGARAATGGHDVPKQKIIDRYERNRALIRAAAELASITMVFDNSKRGKPPGWLFTLEHGQLIAQSDRALPAWADELYFQA